MTTAPVSQFMSKDVACVAVNAPLTDVTNQMHQARYSCVVITDGPRPVGVITERDLTAVCDRLLNREAAGGVSGNCHHTISAAARARLAAKYSGASSPKVANAPLTAGPIIVPMLLAVPRRAIALVRCSGLVWSAA